MSAGTVRTASITCSNVSTPSLEHWYNSHCLGVKPGDSASCTARMMTCAMTMVSDIACASQVRLSALHARRALLKNLAMCAASM